MIFGQAWEPHRQLDDPWHPCVEDSQLFFTQATFKNTSLTKPLRDANRLGLLQCKYLRVICWFAEFIVALFGNLCNLFRLQLRWSSQGLLRFTRAETNASKSARRFPQQKTLKFPASNCGFWNIQTIPKWCTTELKLQQWPNQANQRWDNATISLAKTEPSWTLAHGNREIGKASSAGWLIQLTHFYSFRLYILDGHYGTSIHQWVWSSARASLKSET